MYELKLEEIKKIEFDILQNVANFCEENNIRYYLAYGTLLGAVRHKGFIPWDDDIDIVMPRPDYIKFIQLYSLKKNCDFYVLSTTETNPNHMYTFAKVFDIRTDKIEKGIIYKENSLRGLDIDIFPIDGLPDNIKCYNRFKLHQKKLFSAFLISRIKFVKSNSVIKNILKYMGLTLFHIIGTTTFIKLINKRAMKFNFDDSKYIGCNVSFFSINRERFLKYDFAKPIKMQFEGASFFVPSSYHEYLSVLYGDNYMQLPSKDKQETHHLYQAYWR